MTDQKLGEASILIDACGWLAVVKAGLNLDLSLDELFGPHRLLILDSVKDEIERLASRMGRKGALVTALLEGRVEHVESVSDSRHPDDQLFSLAKLNDWTVLTVDRHLKRRLHEAGCSVLEVVGRKRLVLIE